MSDDRHLYHPDSIYASRWVTCSCGKEHEVGCRDFPELVKLRLDLAEHTLCRSCSQKISQQMDMCPESLGIQGGVSACSLPYEHQGRCQPHPELTAEELAALRKES